jgi:hypothetical protein
MQERPSDWLSPVIVNRSWARLPYPAIRPAPIFPKALDFGFGGRLFLGFILFARRTSYRAQPMLFALTGWRALRVANEAHTGCRVSFPSINNGEPAWRTCSCELAGTERLCKIAHIGQGGAVSNAAGWVWLQGRRLSRRRGNGRRSWEFRVAPVSGCEPPGLINQSRAGITAVRHARLARDGLNYLLALPGSALNTCDGYVPVVPA